MKYMKAMMEAIELEVEDVVLTSGVDTCHTDDCPEDGAEPCPYDA